MKYKVLKSDVANGSSYWVVIQKDENGKSYHTSLNVRHLVTDDYIEIPLDVANKCNWLESRTKVTFNKMNKLSFTSEMPFGLYKGTEIGLVYAFDMEYISWCIQTIESFAIRDLDLLQEIGVFRKSKRYEVHRDKTPNIFPLIHTFNSINELYNEIPVLNPRIRLPEEIFELNQSKLEMTFNQ